MEKKQRKSKYEEKNDDFDFQHAQFDFPIKHPSEDIGRLLDIQI